VTTRPNIQPYAEDHHRENRTGAASEIAPPLKTDGGAGTGLAWSAMATAF